MDAKPKRERLPAGEMLRDWRQRRRFSQLALALEAEISQRHLSFLESGRAQPSREMVLRLTECLQVPLRERNAILIAAGFAPTYGEGTLASAEMAQVRSAIDRILAGHAPHPALAVDRFWTILSANSAVSVLTESAAPSLLNGEVNALRLSLHPDGLAPRILNFQEWRTHILARLMRDLELSASPRLGDLVRELSAYPVPPGATPMRRRAEQAIAVPLMLQSREGPLSFLSTTTVFGTAIDVTLSEIVIEGFFPADAKTAAAMRRLTAPA